MKVFDFAHMLLTHCTLVTPCGIIKLGQHWLRWWLVACSAPSHHLNQWLLIVIWTPTNKLLVKMQWFSFKKMHLKMSSAKCQPFCPVLFGCCRPLVVFSPNTSNDSVRCSEAWQIKPAAFCTACCTWPSLDKRPVALGNHFDFRIA